MKEMIMATKLFDFFLNKGYHGLEIQLKINYAMALLGHKGIDLIRSSDVQFFISHMAVGVKNHN